MCALCVVLPINITSTRWCESVACLRQSRAHEGIAAINPHIPLDSTRKQNRTELNGTKQRSWRRTAAKEVGDEVKWSALSSCCDLEISVEIVVQSCRASKPDLVNRSDRYDLICLEPVSWVHRIRERNKIEAKHKQWRLLTILKQTHTHNESIEPVFEPSWSVPKN